MTLLALLDDALAVAAKAPFLTDLRTGRSWTSGRAWQHVSG